MPRRARRLPAVSFAIYAAVVILLLCLAIFARGYSVSVGDIRLSGRYVPLPLFGSQKIRDLTLSYRGLELRLSRSLPLSVRSGGQESELILDSVRPSAAGAEILFAGGAGLHLVSDAGSRVGYSLVPVSASASVAAFSLLIPFSVQGHLQQVAGESVYSWTQGGRKYLLTLPAESRLDPAAGTMLLSARAGPDTEGLKLAAADAAGESPPSRWPRVDRALPSAADLQAAISRFSDAAYAGWSRKRLSPDGRTWLAADGQYRFVEEIGRALISESISRDAYPRFRALFAEALDARMRTNPGAALSFSSSVFTGNLREYERRLDEQVPLEVERLRRLLVARDPSLFAPGVVVFLADHGPPSLFADVRDFLLAKGSAAADAIAALGMLEASLDYDSLTSAAGPERSKCGELVEGALMPLVRSTASGVFLSESARGDRVLLSESLRCGALFIRAGAVLEKPAIAAMGRGLVVSALGQLRDTGFFPSELEISPKGVTRQTGEEAPEDLYPMVAGKFFPREIPLSRSLGQGAWIYTAADLSVEAASPSGFTLALGFPVGLPHYFLIRGVKPFSQIRLHDIPWRQDPTYFQYSDGYFYDAPSRTLYMKITPRVPREELVVTYGGG